MHSGETHWLPDDGQTVFPEKKSQLLEESHQHRRLIGMK